MLFPYPVAVCDVAGTNCRISIQDGPEEPLRPLPHLLTGDFPGLAEAIQAATGWELGVVTQPVVTPPATDEELDALRELVNRQ